MTANTSTTSTRRAAAYREDSARAVGLIDRVWAASALGAAALMALASFLPLWQMTLNAPQYPGGLHLVAYGTRMQGDLDEINTLNHYVGVRPIEPDTVIELTLFPFAMGALVLLLIAGAFLARRRALRWLLAMAAWAAPVGMLLDLQWWLYRFGHNLNPDAALRLDEFTPKVIGSTEVMNFNSDNMVDIGFWVMVLAALLVTAGPWTFRFVRDSWQNTGTASAAAIVLTLAAGLTLLDPSPAEAIEGSATSLQELVDAAAPGATVLVPAGTYVGQLTIDKPLALDGGGEAVIDGAGQGDVVHITADDVTLRGFIVRHSAREVSGEPAGIRVTGDRATIEGNRLEDVLYGILLDGSDGHVVRDNRVSSILELPAERRGHALYVYDSADTLLTGNTVEHAKDGVFLGFAIRATVEGNTVSHVRYGVHTMYSDDLTLRSNVFRHNIAGASLMYTRGARVIDNEFAENLSTASGFGLLFKDVDDVELVSNRIHHNRLGLTMDGAPRTPGHHVTLRGNLIAYNQVALELFTTTSVTFVENTFVGNLRQVESRGGSLEHHNNWSQEGRGNYWDDYRGYDAGGDGVGDLVYRYEGAFDDLVQRNEALRAYAFTPARGALDLAARWFPAYRPEPRVVDEHPLMSPTIRLPGAADGTQALVTGLTSLAMVLAAVTVVAAVRRRTTEGWR